MLQLHSPPEKKFTLSFPATPLKKLRSCQASFLKIWFEAQPPCRKTGVGVGVGAHYVTLTETEKLRLGL